ncbi:MAG: hypothetical protein P8172_06140 [Gammaproteobacteria bacterium]
MPNNAIIAVLAAVLCTFPSIPLSLSAPVDPEYYASGDGGVTLPERDGSGLRRLSPVLPAVVLVLAMAAIAIAGRSLQREVRSLRHANAELEGRNARLEQRLAARTRQLTMARAAARDRRVEAAPPSGPPGEFQARAEAIVIDDPATGWRRPGCGEMAKVGVAVFTLDGGFARSVEGLLRESYPVRVVPTLAGLSELLARRRAGVLVTDVVGDGPTLRNMMATLRRRLPELVTVLVGEGGEAAGIAGLIDEGNAYRCVAKPVDPGRLMHDVNAAVLRHIRLREQRSLVSETHADSQRIRRHAGIPRESLSR